MAAEQCRTTGKVSVSPTGAGYGNPPLAEMMRDNVFFDTCVYHLPGIELLLKVVPLDNILFASEMVGAVKGIDPQMRASL